MAAADLQNWVPAIELKLKSLTKTKTIELTVLPSLCFQAGCLIHFTAEKLGMQCQIVSDAEINNLTASLRPFSCELLPHTQKHVESNTTFTLAVSQAGVKYCNFCFGTN